MKCARKQNSINSSVYTTVGKHWKNYLLQFEWWLRTTMAFYYDSSFPPDVYPINKELQATEAGTYFEHVVGNFFDSVFALGHGDVVGRLLPCFESISTIYRQSLNDTATRPDWNLGSNRCAYMHRFFALHCHLVYRSLQLSLTNLRHLKESWKHTTCVLHRWGAWIRRGWPDKVS